MGDKKYIRSIYAEHGVIWSSSFSDSNFILQHDSAYFVQAWFFVRQAPIGGQVFNFVPATRVPEILK